MLFIDYLDLKYNNIYNSVKYIINFLDNNNINYIKQIVKNCKSTCTCIFNMLKNNNQLVYKF